MGMWVGRGRKARRCYGFDEIALVPNEVSINPDEVDTAFDFAGRKFQIPIWAASMDGVVDVSFAIKMGKLGGMAVLNLDGVQTRYEDPSDILNEIANSDVERATELLQKIYQPKIKEKLIIQTEEDINKIENKKLSEDEIMLELAYNKRLELQKYYKEL
ncbi:MAG: hypothetical protein EOM23_10975, partial [Candidatus Moranbacteria bacterium]|nr:hypothetical protein [Candidatus Moranbacteria bacterium]